MAKGQIFQLQFHHFNDEDSGVKLTRLTPSDVLCNRTYFYQKCFTNDGKSILFNGQFDGNRNYYLLDLESQSAKQLTEGKGDNAFGAFLSPDDSCFYYVKNDRFLNCVDLSTLQEKTIYTVPDDWVGYGTWVADSNCTKLVGIEIAKEDWVPLDNWQIFKAFYHKNPHCRLITVDLASGNVQVVLDEKIWLGHPIYRPFHSEQIAYCHEGPHDLVDARMWMVNQDGSNSRKVREPFEDESCTHEFWVPNGTALAYVSYIKGQQERYIRAYDPDTQIDKEIMQMPACSHLMSNFDGSLFIGDGTGSPVDVVDTSGYKIENDPWLYVLKPSTKQIIKLVKHNSSWKVIDNDRQVTHPHPSFSPDDKNVLFTSDFEGQPALYLVDVPTDITK